MDVEKQGWWFSQSHPPSFVWWLGPRRLSVPEFGEAMPQQRSNHRFLVWLVWWCQLHRQRQHVQDQMQAYCLLNIMCCLRKCLKRRPGGGRAVRRGAGAPGRGGMSMPGGCRRQSKNEDSHKDVMSERQEGLRGLHQYDCLRVRQNPCQQKDCELKCFAG